MSAVTGAGFRLEFLHEHDYTLFDSLRFLVRDRRGYELPEGLPRIPMMYSLRPVPPDRRTEPVEGVAR